MNTIREEKKYISLFFFFFVALIRSSPLMWPLFGTLSWFFTMQFIRVEYRCAEKKNAKSQTTCQKKATKQQERIQEKNEKEKLL